MKFDSFLNFLFRRALPILIAVVLCLSFTGCIFFDAVSCFCSACSCEPFSEGCVEACNSASEGCDETMRSYFPDDCALADICFGEGCEYRTDDCYVGCLGCGHKVMTCQKQDYGCGMTCLGDSCDCDCAICTVECGHN